MYASLIRDLSLRPSEYETEMTFGIFCFIFLSCV